VTLIGTKPQAGNEFEVLHSSTGQYEVIVDTFTRGRTMVIKEEMCSENAVI
jgi:hypothetical protein